MSQTKTTLHQSFRMIDKLYWLENEIFREFALETSTNPHVEAVDLNNPLTSISKIFLSDIVSSQIHFRNKDLPLIIPNRMLIQDNSSCTYSYFQIGPDGIAFIRGLFKKLNADNIAEMLKEFRSEVLTDSSNFYRGLPHWVGKDALYTSCPAYERLTSGLENAHRIVFDNSDWKAIKEDEKVNYLILITYELDQSNCDSRLREEDICNFLDKISILALHTKRNRKSFFEIERQATKAAISQVMARNMSHNIGSHVMNRITSGMKLEGISNLDAGSYGPAFPLADFKSRTDLQGQPLPQRLLELVNVIHQLASFNHYVKCRMDYLSDITFGTPVMHTNKRVAAELFKELDKVRFLLHYAPGLSTFKYRIQFLFDGRQISESEDIDLAVPNDLLGCQAFYNIIENVIRNTAKHSAQKGATTLFTINIRNVSHIPPDLANQRRLSAEIRTLYAVEIYDDCVLSGNKEFSTGEQKQKTDYIANYNGCNENQLEENASVSNIEWLVYRLNKKINQSVLQQNNQLRTSSLGLIEMQASAAYLRKLDSSAIEHKANVVEYNDKIYNSAGNLNILKAFGMDGRLGYRFFVSKPTEILLVGNFDMNIDTDDLLKAGIWLRSEASFRADLENGVVYSHPFVLYERSETISALLAKYKTSLPLRHIDISDKKKSLERLLNANPGAKDMEDWVWSLHFDQIKGEVEHINVITSYHQKYGRPNTYNIGFTAHASGWKARVGEKEENLIHYLEPLSSQAEAKLPNHPGTIRLHSYLFSNKDKLYLTNVAKKKIFESAITKILVLDERIQRFSEDNYEADGAKISNKDIFAYSNVVIPNRNELQLDADNFTSDLVVRIENFIDENLTECEFMLVHYSILERMYRDIVSINEKLSLWSRGIRVVVTSGRGKPADLPSAEVCFVNLSPVLNVFVEARSKFAMNYLMQSARR
jgi:hypothetical protein